MVTDKLKSYGAAKQEIAPRVEHRQHKGLNNRAENSHQPTRQWERQMRRFKSPRHAQQVLSAHDQINNLFYLRHHRLTAVHYRAARDRPSPYGRRSLGLHEQRDRNANCRPDHPLLPRPNNLTMPSSDRRIECDLFYIRHWSYMLDIKILFIRLRKGFINKNAY